MTSLRSLSFVTLLAALLNNSTLANERIFTYTYQSSVLTKGQREIEIWNTFHLQRENFYRKFRHRIEYEIGLGGGVQTAFYLNAQHVAAFRPGSPPSIEKEIELGFSSEWKFKLSDPAADLIGSALYFELGVLADEFSMEGKLILDKQIGKTTHALNFVAEPEWAEKIRGIGIDTEFELGFDVVYGFSYEMGSNWNLGIEARNHNKYTRDNGVEYSVLFAGPAVAYHTTGWWLALTVMPQVYAFRVLPRNSNSHRELLAHEQLESRMIFSYEF